LVIETKLTEYLIVLYRLKGSKHVQKSPIKPAVVLEKFLYALVYIYQSYTFKVNKK